MSELSPEARALLEAARRDGAPTEADRQRVERALAQVLGTPPAAPTSARLAPSRAALPVSGSVTSSVVRAVVVAALAAVGAAIVAVWATPSPEPAPLKRRSSFVQVGPSAPVPAGAPASDVEVVPAPTAVPVLVPQPQQPTLAPVPSAQTPRLQPVQRRSPVFAPLDLREPAVPPASVASPAPLAPTESQLAEELRLMSRAQLELRSGNAAGALDALDEYVRSFPRGALREEQVAARVQALCALHRVPEARAETVQFLADHPQSPYTAKVRASCGAAP